MSPRETAIYIKANRRAVRTWSIIGFRVSVAAPDGSTAALGRFDTEGEARVRAGVWARQAGYVAHIEPLRRFNLN